MKLIIGGAYQGKLAYARETYNVQDGWIDGRTCAMEEIVSCRGISQFHEYVKRMLTEAEGVFSFRKDDLVSFEEQAAQFVCMLKERNPQMIAVTNELGYGVVPMEKDDRMWREATGRICTAFAKEAEEVVRVVCGIGTRIK